MTGSQGWGESYSRVSRLGHSATLLFLQGTRTSVAADETTPAFIWFSDHKTLIQINAVTHEVRQTYRLEEKPIALAADPTDNTLWVLGKHEFFKLDADANRLLDIDFKELAKNTRRSSSLL